MKKTKKKKPAARKAKAKRSQPESLRGRALSTSLTVKDLQSSVAWYRDVVGFTVGKEYSFGGKVGAVALKAGSVELILNQDDGAKGLDRVKGEGFSIQITTAQKIDDIAQRITSRGGTLDVPPTDAHWGARFIRFRDPDGFRFVISSK